MFLHSELRAVESENDAETGRREVRTLAGQDAALARVPAKTPAARGTWASLMEAGLIPVGRAERKERPERPRLLDRPGDGRPRQQARAISAQHGIGF